MALAAGVGAGAAAEYGTGPWVPPQAGLYVRNDAYHYEGEVGATIFDGNVQLGVEERYLAEDFGRHLRRRRRQASCR